MLARVLYLVLGLAAAALAITLAFPGKAGVWPVIVFAVAPDLTLLGGFGPGLERGRLNPKAVPFYNAVHRFWAPAVMVAAGLLAWSPGWAAAGLAWVAHIGFDRCLGFGLRTPEGFQRPPAGGPVRTG